MLISKKIILASILVLIVASGCSSSGNPLVAKDLENPGVLGLMNPHGDLGILGAFNVNVDSNLNVELTSKRMNTTGSPEAS